MLILEFVSAEDCFHLGGSGGFATKSHQPQRGGHHHRRNDDVLCVFLLCHGVVEAKVKFKKIYAYIYV